MIASAMDVGAAPIIGPSTPALAPINSLNWLLALVIVLMLFFACVWILRKLNGGNGPSNSARMRIVGGVTLGLREKVVLLQVGSKQLVLAVTPGRIETLTVLEGDDCVTAALSAGQAAADTQFAQKLMQALKGRLDG